jgi:hypothetical protein
MKIIGVLFGLIIAVQSHARDYGDKNCNVVIVKAENEITGCCGNYYRATIAVSKTIIAQNFQKPDIRLQFNERGLSKPEDIIDVKETSRYKIFSIKLPFGASYHTDSLDLIAYVSNGIDRLYDNNFGVGQVSLEQANSWIFRQTRCNLN